jgi:hypothetical protein
VHLAALSAGEQAPRGRFNGAVHSVFREACNIRVDDGRMLTLLASRLGNVPHGVRVAAPPGFDFARQVAPTQRVGCRADVLRLAGGLSIDLGTARAWHGELPAAGVDLTVEAVARAWRAAWRAWQRGRARADHTEVTALSRAVDHEVDHAAVRLARAAGALQLGEATSALDRLVGRGPGLTPSGDDVIVGLLAGLWSSVGERSVRRAFLNALGTAVTAAAAATGDISRIYLTHAAHGRFAEPLIVLMHHIGAGADRSAIEAAAAAALRVGHSSGGDGVFGLLLGLGAWAPRAASPERHRLRHGTVGLRSGKSQRGPRVDIDRAGAVNPRARSAEPRCGAQGMEIWIDLPAGRQAGVNGVRRG